MAEGRQRICRTLHSVTQRPNIQHWDTFSLILSGIPRPLPAFCHFLSCIYYYKCLCQPCLAFLKNTVKQPTSGRRIHLPPPPPLGSYLKLMHREFFLRKEAGINQNEEPTSEFAPRQLYWAAQTRRECLVGWIGVDWSFNLPGSS